MDNERKKTRDVKDVIREERSRGRRQTIDVDAERQQEELRKGYLELINGDDEEKFCQGLIALGYQPSSERYRQFLHVWRSMKRPTRRA